jgi:ribosomal protein L3 glutamine methyltransferase
MGLLSTHEPYRISPAELQEALAKLITVRDFIRWGASRLQQGEVFYGHGNDNPWDEACQLVLHCLHLPRDIHAQVLDGRLTAKEREAVVALLQSRILTRMPAAYLTNEAWFAGMPFYVDERVIVPRSPMAELIQNRFAPWIPEDHIAQILDLCTGSACIAIACAHALPQATIDAIDVSMEALEVAEINVEKHHVEQQVRLLHADLFEGLTDERYDVMICNPPYVNEKDLAEMPSEFSHEPNLALAAGQDGLDLVRRILREAAQFLTPHGVLFVEVGNSEVALQEAYREVPFTWLEFQCGGHGVFALTREQLLRYQAYW